MRVLIAEKEFCETYERTAGLGRAKIINRMLLLVEERALRINGL